MIVVEGNEASEYYSNYCIPSWEKIGLKVEKFKAVTPDDVPKIKEIRFEKYSTNLKYLNRGLKAEITDTEKAVWCSHFKVWEECCYSNEPILVLEHDTFLEYPENLWYDESYDIIFFDKAAMGSYIITPKFAKKLIDRVFVSRIGGGPYGFIASMGPSDTIVNERHSKYNPASNQVMSEKYGNTVMHYCNLHPEHWPSEDFHKFILIP